MTKPAPTPRTTQASPLAIETDVSKIIEAMRTLTGLVTAEERKLLDADGKPPVLPTSEVGRIINNPVGEGARAAWNRLYQLLCLLIGDQAAVETQQRLNAELPQPPSPASAPDGIPFRSLAQH